VIGCKWKDFQPCDWLQAEGLPAVWLAASGRTSSQSQQHNVNWTCVDCVQLCLLILLHYVVVVTLVSVSLYRVPSNNVRPLSFIAHVLCRSWFVWVLAHLRSILYQTHLLTLFSSVLCNKLAPCGEQERLTSATCGAAWWTRTTHMCHSWISRNYSTNPHNSGRHSLNLYNYINKWDHFYWLLVLTEIMKFDLGIFQIHTIK